LSDSIGVSQNAASPSGNGESPEKGGSPNDVIGSIDNALEPKGVAKAEVAKPSGIRFASKLEGMKLRSGTLL